MVTKKYDFSKQDNLFTKSNFEKASILEYHIGKSLKFTAYKRGIHWYIIDNPYDGMTIEYTQTKFIKYLNGLLIDSKKDKFRVPEYIVVKT